MVPPVGVAKLPPVIRSNTAVRERGGEETGLLAEVSGRHVVRRRQTSPIPAQQPAVVGGSKEVRQGDRQGW